MDAAAEFPVSSYIAWDPSLGIVPPTVGRVFTSVNISEHSQEKPSTYAQGLHLPGDSSFCQVDN